MGNRGKVVPVELRRKILLRLEVEQERYVRHGHADWFLFEFRGEYLYIGVREDSGFSGRGISDSPLCRLRFLGDPDVWALEVYTGTPPTSTPGKVSSPSRGERRKSALPWRPTSTSFSTPRSTPE